MNYTDYEAVLKVEMLLAFPSSAVSKCLNLASNCFQGLSSKVTYSAFKVHPVVSENQLAF